MKVLQVMQKFKKQTQFTALFAVLYNKYALIWVLFVIWMVFFDTNSWLIHKELDDEIRKLEKNKRYYYQEIVKDKAKIKTLNDSSQLEKFARETYYMKRDDEEVFLIEYSDKNTN